MAHMPLHPHLEATHDHLSNAVKSLMRALSDDGPNLPAEQTSELIRLLVRAEDSLVRLTAEWSQRQKEAERSDGSQGKRGA